MTLLHRPNTVLLRSAFLAVPQLTRSNELVIEGGRHLLTEQLVETFIPNDTAMQATRDRIQAGRGGASSLYGVQVHGAHSKYPLPSRMPRRCQHPLPLTQATSLLCIAPAPHAACPPTRRLSRAPTSVARAATPSR